MVSTRRLVLMVLAWYVSTAAAFANYHFLHYTSRPGPFTPVPEKFDLNAVANRTLFFFVSTQGPEQMAPGDSFTSILSQIRLGAKAWSDVETSELQLEFGGLLTPGTPQSNPGIDVLFTELPPGLVALGGPTTRAGMVSGDSGAFVPITRSVLILQKDLSQRPSFTDAFFLTVVHEMGHALGLQHTLASSVMSTQVTRATTRSKPLAPDDVAGLSLLYPTADFPSQVGSISGRVTLGGQGVHLASVVALAPNGPAVSALSDPDGFYRIDGLPPGNYYLYAHPLPPSLQPELGPADIVLPVDPDGSPFPAGPVFRTQFYPGTHDLWQAQVIAIQPGSNLESFDFAGQQRGALQLFGVTTYSFPGSVAVKPAFVNVNGSRKFLVASGVGLITNEAPTPGLRAGVVGSARVEDDGVQAYAPAPAFLQIEFQFNPFSSEGTRHLIFSLDEDIYVLPAGLNLVQKQPPSIGSVTPFLDNNGKHLARITGSGLFPGTRILFDGAPATIAGLDETAGTMVVVPPPGASNHSAVVTAVNPDGQDSLFLDVLAPPSFTYEPTVTPFVAVTPIALPAGSEAMIEVLGTNTNFVDGQTVVGFGTSDVVVRRVWVLSPTHLVANVHVAPSTALISNQLTLVTGFQIVSQPFALEIQAPNPQALVPNPRLLNPFTGQPSIYAGGQALLFVSNLSANTSGVTLTLNDAPARILSTEEGQISFEVPSELNIGPAVLRLQVGAERVAPIVVSIDPPPPIVISVTTLSRIPIDADRPAVAGESLVVWASGLADPGVVNAPDRLLVNIGGVDHVPVSVTASEDDPNMHELWIKLSASVPTGSFVPVTATIDYRTSQPFLIPIGATE
jgi:uncharacterized protein (TIGR03437 family)